MEVLADDFVKLGVVGLEIFNHVFLQLR